MLIPLVGSSSPTRIVNEDIQETINWFVEENTKGGLFKLILMPTPGLVTWLDTEGGEVRDLLVHKTKLYAVVDNKLYSIVYVAGVPTKTLINTFTTSTGRVIRAAINNQIIWVDGDNGYHYNTDTSTFTQISDAEFPADCAYITAMNNYFIALKPNSDLAYVSDLTNGLSWTATSFFGVTRKEDNLVGAVNYNSQLVMIGERSTEVFYDSGEGTPTFKPVDGGVFEYGCLVAATLITGDGSIFFVARDENGQRQVVRIYSGYQIEVVSSRAIAQALYKLTSVSDMFAYMYQQEGHEFYVLVAPSDNKTFVFDVTTNQWHNRDSFNGNNFIRHRGNCHAVYEGLNLVGDYLSGKIFKLDPLTYTDDGQYIRRKRITVPIFLENKRLTIYKLEILTETGLGLGGTGQGSNPLIQLRLSRDGGHTWGNTLYSSVGKQGEYSKRNLFLCLGSGRQWVFEILCTEPVKIALLGAVADIDPELDEHAGQQQ